jgi:hypothetical protein
MKKKRLATLTTVILAVGIAFNTLAQDFDLSWHTIDGGGGTSTGGGYELSGTVGQPDVGEMAGGTYSLTGGFWAGSSGSVTGECANACGDLNGSGGDVDLVDFSGFSVCFGLSGPSAACPQEDFDCSDLNGDGVIDLVDFSTFSVLFGTVSTNEPPNCL